MSEKYDVDYNYLRKYASKNKWNHKREKYVTDMSRKSNRRISRNYTEIICSTIETLYYLRIEKCLVFRSKEVIFLYMDIRDYEEDTMYKSQVTQWGKNINIMLIYKTNLNKFFIYKQESTQTNKYELNELQNIDIVKQKTGFGHKKFFKCHHCGHKRQNLYFVEDTLKFVCRECIDVNIYSSRTNLYDGDVKNVILYKSIKIMRSLKTEISHISMYTLIENIPYRPRYMRQEKYELAVKRLYFLHWMWEQCYTAEYGPAVGITPKLDKLNVQQINEMLQEDNANFVYEHFLFPQYYREAYEVLKALKDKGLIDE